VTTLGVADLSVDRYARRRHDSGSVIFLSMSAVATYPRIDSHPAVWRRAELGLENIVKIDLDRTDPGLTEGGP
jgi:hypothetical protein